MEVIYAVKQFHHYLLSRKFTLVTDHAPLQWLSAQKMQGLLCRWALALQEYDFEVVHRKGSLNTNADALSRRSYSTQVATTQAASDVVKAEIHEAQMDDPVNNQLANSGITPHCTTIGKYGPNSPYLMVLPAGNTNLGHSRSQCLSGCYNPVFIIVHYIAFTMYQVWDTKE